MHINPNSPPVTQTPQNKEPPAKVARDAITAQPDLMDQSPFGQLVSQIARGNWPPPTET